MLAGSSELFSYELRVDGRVVAVLRGVQGDTGVTVQAEVRPVGSAPEQPPLRRPFTFQSREQARRFVDDALAALEYVGAVVSE